MTRTWEYDSYHRLTGTLYSYPGSANWQPPFEAENLDETRLLQPTPQVSFDQRIQQENFEYDWLNNLTYNGDDANGFYDRSLGNMEHDGSHPNRLTSADNRDTGSPRAGALSVSYDDAGQVTGMVVERDGTCLPAGASCWQRYAYEWDEVGNLSRARRWDLGSGERTSYGTTSSALPDRAPDAELTYQYDGDQRVLKTSHPVGDPERHTVYVFSTLELRSTTWEGEGEQADFARSSETEQVLLGAGAVAARIVSNPDMPRLTDSQQHVLLQFGDQLGSTAFSIDKGTGELVEYTTYTSYGTTESDYRPERWGQYREPYRYTGKEEDQEVGLEYHGARYYALALRRWMSADPVTVHSGGSDINPYSYGRNNPTAYVDPDGRDPTLLTVVIIAMVVSGGTNAYVQYQTTGHVDWGWHGVAGAAVAGGIGAAVGMGVGGLAASYGWGAVGAAALGGAAGGSVTGFVGTGLGGGSFGEMLSSAYIGGASGAAGGAVGAMAGAQSADVGAAFGGGLVGTFAGTAAGVGLGTLAFGDEMSMQEVGWAFAGAAIGAVGSAALSQGLQAAAHRSLNLARKASLV